MEHDEAQTTMAAERYLLGEMPVEEREAFEAHYFDCAECAADVRDETVIADGIRRTSNVVPFRTRVASRASWLVTAAAVGGMAFFGYQNVLLRGAASMAASMNAPVVPHHYDVHFEERGPEPLTIENPNEPLEMTFEVPPDYQRYTIHLRNGAGSDVATTEVAAGEPVVSYFVPPRLLKPGKYTLAIDGLTGNRRQPNVKTMSIVVQSR